MNERFRLSGAVLALFFIPFLLNARNGGFSDDFNSGTLDPAKWQSGNHSGNFSAVQNSQLVLRSSSQKTGWIYSTNAHSLEGKTIAIKSVQPNKDGCLGISPTVTGTAPTGFYNEQNWYRFYNYRPGNSGPFRLYVQWRKNGVVGGLDVASGVDFQSNFYLRIRSENGHLFFEYSFDDQTWQLAYDEAYNLPGRTTATPHYIELSAYSTPENGDWIVDDFMLQDIGAPADTVAPQITGVSSVPAATTAEVSWQTDEPATSMIYWGTSTVYSDSAAATAGLATTHQISLANLQPQTDYHFQISATDVAGNRQHSPDFIFTTTAQPVGTGISDNYNSGIIDPAIWETGNPGGNQSYVSNGELHLAANQNSGWQVTRQNDVLRGKSISLKVVQANNDGAIGISPTRSVAATHGFYGESTWYRFYNYRDSDSGPYKLYVQWRKNGTVAGLDVATGETFGSNFFLRLRIGNTQIYFEYSHDNLNWTTAYQEAFALDNSTVDDLYFAELAANNSTQNGEWIVDDFNWQATAASGDTTAPQVSQVTVSNISESSASINWQTDEPATAQVEYGSTAAYGQLSPLDVNYQTTHSMDLTNLLAGTAYHFRVISRDAAGNERRSSDAVFTTSIDTLAPVVSGISVNSVTANSASVHFTTNEFAYSMIQFGTTAAYGDSTGWTAGTDTTHSLTLQNLLPATLYHYRILAKDMAGNQRSGGDSVFTTLNEGAFFSDDFSGTVIDANKWFAGQNGGNRSAIANGQLVLKSVNGETGWIVTQDAFALRNSTARVKVAQPNDDGNIGISPTYTGTATNGFYQEPAWYRFYVYRSAGENFHRLYIQWRKNGIVGGLDVTGSLRINGTVWLQMRCDNAQIYFDISLDGSVWFTVYNEAFSLDSWTLDDAFHYEIAAYRTDVKGEMRVDDFSLRDGAIIDTVPAATWRILLVGNSITAGIGSSDEQGFRPGLYQKMLDAGYDFAFVGSEGASPYGGHFFPGKEIDDFFPPEFGNGSGSGLHDIANAMQIYQPNVVAIHLGTNDLTQETFIAPYSDDGGASFNQSTSGQLATLLRYILQWRDGSNGDFLQDIFLSQIIPGSDRMDKISQLNSEIANLIQGYQSGTITGVAEPVHLVDHFNPINANPDLFTYNANDYMSDYLHPNDSGYAVMATTYFDAFLAQLPVQTGGAAGKNVTPGGSEITAPGPLPATFALAQNYPNPFAPQRHVFGTAIEFQMPVQSQVKLEIYNILGQRVRTLMNRTEAAGRHKIYWDGRAKDGLSVAPGLYFYLLRTPQFTARKKLTILR